MENTKQQALAFCKDQLAQKRSELQKAIALLKQSLTAESKSTAGDKHETGRAMIQLEREKLGFQLKELESQEALLHKINLQQTTPFIALGSYVSTTLMNYFLSISIGKIASSNAYAISVQSPIGKQLLGKKLGETFTFNGKEHKITGVL